MKKLLFIALLVCNLSFAQNNLSFTNSVGTMGAFSNSVSTMMFAGDATSGNSFAIGTIGSDALVKVHGVGATEFTATANDSLTGVLLNSPNDTGYAKIERGGDYFRIVSASRPQASGFHSFVNLNFPQPDNNETYNLWVPLKNGTVAIETAASGVFHTCDGKTIVITNGIITSITP